MKNIELQKQWINNGVYLQPTMMGEKVTLYV